MSDEDNGADDTLERRDSDTAASDDEQSRFGLLRDRFRRSRTNSPEEPRAEARTESSDDDDGDGNRESEPRTAESSPSPVRDDGLDGWVWGSREHPTPNSVRGGSDTEGDDMDSGAPPNREGGEQSNPEGIVGESSSSGRVWNAVSERDGAVDGSTGTDADQADSPDGSTDSLRGAGEDRGVSSSDRAFDIDSEIEPSPDSDTELDEDEELDSGSDPDSETESRWDRLGSKASDGTAPATETDREPPSEDLEADPIDPTDTVDEDSESRWDRLSSGAVSGPDTSKTVTESGAETSIGGLDRILDSPRVFALGPSGHPISETVCSRFLTGASGSRNALFVSFDDSPIDWRSICERSDGWSGSSVGVIHVGRSRDPAPDTDAIAAEIGAESVTIRRVSRAGDLSKLGIVATQLLSQLDSTPRRTVLCFHTLSALHQHVGTKTLFRFLNTLHGRLESSDAIGYYQMDPELHDEIVIETLRPIFESVVRFSAEGDLEVE